MGHKVDFSAPVGQKAKYHPMHILFAYPSATVRMKDVNQWKVLAFQGS